MAGSNPHVVCVHQEWRGYVMRCHDESFWARLETVAGEGGDVDALLLLRHVRSEDRPLVQPGAAFTWTILEAPGPLGPVTDSVIRFDRGKG